MNAAGWPGAGGGTRNENSPRASLISRRKPGAAQPGLGFGCDRLRHPGLDQPGRQPLARAVLDRAFDADGAECGSSAVLPALAQPSALWKKGPTV